MYRADESYNCQKSAFLINHEIWAQNGVKALELSILGNILFSKELIVDLGLLELSQLELKIRLNMALLSFLS